jgi:hypothetical protein
MSRQVECPFEADVLTAVYTSRWPDRAEPELRAHVATCGICTDIVAIAPAFEEDYEQVRAEAHVPDAGLVWWRAQMRARTEAARAAVRPITVAQAVGFAAAVGVIGAVFGATTTWFQQALQWIGGAFSSLLTLRLPELPAGLVAAITEHGIWLLGGAVCFVLATVALYLAVRDQERET